MLIGIAPRQTVIFHGNWDLLGLRGTGSYGFEVREQALIDAGKVLSGADGAVIPMTREGYS